MVIASYNIWDSPAGMPFRLSQITDEITACSADLICLQEVCGIDRCEKIAQICGYPYTIYDEKLFLAILSKIPIVDSARYPCAIAGRMDLDDTSVLLINVHLPWQSAVKRENVMVEINYRIQAAETGYVILAGDFNCSDTSSVHRFLKNEQSLLGQDAYFFDLAEAYAQCTRTVPEMTLDFQKNPRWKDKSGKLTNTIEPNQRFDRILLKNPYPNTFPELKEFRIFGTEISGETGYVASDHYGVFARLIFR